MKTIVITGSSSGIGKATDSKNKLRYLVGADAKQISGMRQQVGDDAFLAGMKQQTLS